MNLDQCIGKTMTGKELASILNGLPLIKFMNDNDVHYGMKYETGNNHDILEFNNSGKDEMGGIYCTTINNYQYHCYYYGYYARRVYIPSHALVYIQNNSLKCSEVILGEKLSWKVLLKDLFTEYAPGNEMNLLQIVKKYVCVIEHIQQQFRTHEMMLEVVKKNGFLIELFEEKFRTYDILHEAVKQKGCVLRLIKKELWTKELINEAIKNDKYLMLDCPTVNEI